MILLLASFFYMTLARTTSYYTGKCASCPAHWWQGCNDGGTPSGERGCGWYHTGCELKCTKTVCADNGGWCELNGFPDTCCTSGYSCQNRKCRVAPTPHPTPPPVSTTTRDPTPPPVSTTTRATYTTSDSEDQLTSGNRVWLRAHTGKHLHVNPKNDDVEATYDYQGEYQQWIIEKAGGGKINAGDTIFLKSYNAKYMDIEGQSVKNRWNSKGNWQKITIEKNDSKAAVEDGDSIFLKSQNTGKYVDVQDTSARARWNNQGVWEKLTIEKNWDWRNLEEKTMPTEIQESPDVEM